MLPKPTAKGCHTEAVNCSIPPLYFALRLFYVFLFFKAAKHFDPRRMQPSDNISWACTSSKLCSPVANYFNRGAVTGPRIRTIAVLLQPLIWSSAPASETAQRRSTNKIKRATAPKLLPWYSSRPLQRNRRSWQEKCGERFGDTKIESTRKRLKKQLFYDKFRCFSPALSCSAAALKLRTRKPSSHSAHGRVGIIHDEKWPNCVKRTQRTAWARIFFAWLRVLTS